MSGGRTQYLTQHRKKEEDIGRWELCKLALPPNVSLYAVLPYLGITIVQARIQMNLETYPSPWWRWKSRGETEDFKPSEKSQTSLFSLLHVLDASLHTGKCGWGSAGLGGKGFREGSRAREQLLSIPRHPWRLSRWKSEWELTQTELVLFQLPKRKNPIFSSYIILVCSYVTRYLMTVKYCIVLILKMHTSLEDHSHFSRCSLNATFTNTFIFLLLLTCSLTF